mmetsp:Transcript_15519/g.49498  ORF Transcript_15519/g.49498 Transcript_15519/m.49498 type:complete len:160 (+) Transcript_15519:1-480(+)
MVAALAPAHGASAVAAQRQQALGASGRECFACPRRSTATRACPRGFRDCECRGEAERDEAAERCLRPCGPPFACPANSRERQKRRCVDSFDDCRCKRGFDKDVRREVCVPQCDFVCPPNSSERDDVDECGFARCQCSLGFNPDLDREVCVRAVFDKIRK